MKALSLQAISLKKHAIVTRKYMIYIRLLKYKFEAISKYVTLSHASVTMRQKKPDLWTRSLFQFGGRASYDRFSNSIDGSKSVRGTIAARKDPEFIDVI